MFALSISIRGCVTPNRTSKPGVAQLNLSLKDIGNLELSLPSLSDQQKIAAELDKIQSAIDNKKQQLSLLDEAVKSKSLVKQQIADLQELLDSKMQQYFA
ncbi:MAG: restriction endonuclease subunit S [Treponema sp.]|nr:restriction endonuclease subunit S [Treponema sp.]